MTELTLIRHGQAQTGATDEASYDSLSDLGHRQAGLLGEYLARHSYDHVVSGTLTRQIQTTEGLARGEDLHRDARLNEMDYFGLGASLERSHGVVFPTSKEAFIKHSALVFEAWQAKNVEAHLESFADFQTRITGALRDVSGEHERVLMVTSTGVIATLAAIALGLNNAMLIKTFLNTAHTSVHKFRWDGDELHLTQFGATPHLDHLDVGVLKTFV